MNKSGIIISIMLIMLAISGQAQNKWKWELGLGGSQNSGNVNNFNLKHHQDISRNDSTITINMNYKVIYQKDNGVESNKGLNGGLKFDLFQYGKWSPYVASEWMSNHYKGYELKFSGLGGLKYRLISVKDKCDYSLSLAIIYEKIKYTNETTDLKKDMCRISLRPKFKQKIGDNITIKHISFYQPRLNEWSDYVINTSTSIENKITSKLFLDISFNYEYRSVIPEDVKKNYDISTDISLKIKL